MGIKKSIFNVVDWQEQFVYQEKLAQAKTVYQMTGGFEGEIHAAYTIHYLSYNKEDIHASESQFEA